MAQETVLHPTTFEERGERELVATRLIDAPRPLVWEAHTLEQHIQQWMYGPEGWTMPICEIDPRPGGTWRYVWERPNGESMEIRGRFREVVSPQHLVNTEVWGDEWPETLNTLDLAEEGAATRITTVVEYPDAEARQAAIATGMEDGWAQSYDRLEWYLKTLR